MIIISFQIACAPVENYEIESLWNLNVHQSEINTFYRCDECNTNSKHCCIYEYNGKKYDRRESYILNNAGNIDSIYSYLVPLGVNILPVADQIRISTLDSGYREELRNRKIYWNSELVAIVDGDSFYLDFKVDADKKYLVVKRQNQLKLYKYK